MSMYDEDFDENIEDDEFYEMWDDADYEINKSGESRWLEMSYYNYPLKTSFYDCIDLSSDDEVLDEWED